MATSSAVRADFLSRAGNFLREATGWGRFLLSLGAGAASALAFEPYRIFPLLLMAYAALVLLLDGASVEVRRVRAAAFTGWAFGFGQFLVGLYWVGYAFTVDAATHAWQIPLVETLLPGGLALYPALACAMAMFFWRPGSARILLLSLLLAVSEWLRGHLFTGFPWNLAAYGWGASLEILQSAAIFGAYGLSFLTILLGCSLAAFCSRPRRQPILPLVMLIVFALFWTGGAIRLTTQNRAEVPNVRLRIVQPNIPEREKFDPRYVVRNWRRLIELSAAPASVQITHIIWSESAPSFLLDSSPDALRDIALLTGAQRTLLTGVARIESRDGERRFYNSFYVFGPGGRLGNVYDKFHLVPFGEYLPLASFFHSIGIDRLVNSPGVFSSGDGPRSLKIPGAPLGGPLICYEIIFPGAVTGAQRPGWLINVTNDSWFGNGAGPLQHLLIARVRAIEEGLPIARSASTGVSAIIDPMGRLTAQLALNKMGTLDASLPGALPPTLYSRFGDLIFALMLIFCVLLAFGIRRTVEPAA